MNGDPDGPDEQVTGNDAEESGGPETLIDVLTGADVRATPKNRLVQQVLRQLIETVWLRPPGHTHRLPPDDEGEAPAEGRRHHPAARPGGARRTRGARDRLPVAEAAREAAEPAGRGGGPA